MHSIRSRLLVLGLAVAAGVMAVRADEKPKEPPRIEVRVLSILASNNRTEIDKRLKAFAEEVQKKDPKLTGFRLERTTNDSIPLGETQKLKIADGQEVEITVNKPSDRDGKITLTIKPPKLSEITYECVCDKYMAIATQHFVGKDKEREQLFIAVMAKPCSLKKKP